MATNKEKKINGVMTPVTDFDHSAQEIDDATARALAGGEIDQLLAGKASAYEQQPEIEITSDYLNAPIYVKKDDAGNVHINIWNASTLKTIPQYGWTTMCNIPIGYRPSYTIILTSRFFSDTTLYAPACIMVTTGGDLSVTGGGDIGVAIPNNSHVHFSGSWGT